MISRFRIQAVVYRALTDAQQTGDMLLSKDRFRMRIPNIGEVSLGQ